MSDGVLGASFRDPSGFVFRRDGVVLRQVNERYAEDYDALMSSGLYEKLVSKGLLLPHEEVDVPPERPDGHYRTLRPEQLDFVSYPYEWCFSQLADAARVTLRIQRIAMSCDLALKDASVYNIQFHRGRPVFIDTLSFERYREGEPWVGYRQFCQHFLAPLALMAHCDVRLQQLLRPYIDGVPLDLAASLLPRRTWLSMGLVTHLRLHARYQGRFEGVGAEAEGAKKAEASRGKLPRNRLLNLVKDLEATVAKLRWKPEGTEWADYTQGDSYEEAALVFKQQAVARLLEATAPRSVWDLGANTGVYSRIAAQAGADVMSFDVDPACVERNYLDLKEQLAKAAGGDASEPVEARVLPLLLDLVNPSPAIGFANEERASISERAGADVVLALALIHHIAISNNVPLDRISAWFAKLAPGLVIEWVPKSDAKVKTLLATREDVFPNYTREGFERAFSRDWTIEESVDIEGSERVLYRLRRRPVAPA